MTKADIVSEISKSTGIDKQTVLSSVESFMEIVKGSLAKGENVYLRGFGSFVIKKRAQKTARNISKKHDDHYSGAQHSVFQTRKDVLERGEISNDSNHLIIRLIF